MEQDSAKEGQHDGEPEKEDIRTSSEDLMESTPEAEAEAGGPSHQENPGQPKRKGGRKPVRDNFQTSVI
jgi:hypothetical protein